MATFTKYALSGSTNGAPITVAATGATGTAIHTAVSGTSSWDEIWLYATNNSDANVTFTIVYGGTNITNTIAAKSGLALIVPGLILNNAKTVQAYADTASVISIFGWVNRIT